LSLILFKPPIYPRLSLGTFVGNVKIGIKAHAKSLTSSPSWSQPSLSLIFKKVSGAVVATLVTGLVSLFNLGLLFWYSWRLAMISVFLVGIMLTVIVVLLAGQLRQEAMIRKVEGSIISFLLEIVGGMTKLRTAGAENRAFGRWAARYADQLGLIIQSRRYSRGLHLFRAVFPMLIAIVIYFGTIHLGPDRLSTGNFLALSIALANVITAVLAVGYTLLDLLDLPPLYDRVKPILEAQPEFSRRRARAGAPGRSPGPWRGLVPLSRPGRRDQGAQRREPAGPPRRVRRHRRCLRLGEVHNHAALARIRNP
jgi:ABC-type bacteriocin/lantibiotic exporter with double-glycine peptidase domain